MALDRRPSRYFVLFLGWCLAGSWLISSASAQEVEAPQGSVARWAGEGTVSCGMDGRIWPAVEGSCYYPIDLERSPGTVEIARWLEGRSIETGWLRVVEQEFELQEIEIDEKYVHPSEEDLARHYSEQAEIKPIFRRKDGDPRFTLPLAQAADPPLPEARFFGVRRVFNGEPKNPHTGVDYAIGLDNPVRAVASGTVVLTGEHLFAGRSIYLYHGAGLVSMYFHLNEISVEEGQEVQQGDQIGKVGSTGRSTGPHLHLGFRWMGAKVDPTLLLKEPSALPAVSP